MKTACTEAWIRYTNLRSTATGSLSTTSASEQSCLAECLANTACVFVDYVTSTQQCWIHTNAANLGQIETSAGVNQFVLLRRCGPSEREYHRLTMPLPNGITKNNLRYYMSRRYRPPHISLFVIGQNATNRLSGYRKCQQTAQQSGECFRELYKVIKRHAEITWYV